eukprot:GHVN01004625.1.p2 GENE.GHVN01004625.1~~GHVN01004625.1.p2  ORF type:complete len:230 (+),score=37.24 GHVN01004625.1:927-1616(+)
MQKDDLIWMVIGNQFCRYRTKTEKSSLCGNKYNLTGNCNREDCPLSNAKYATVREKDGKLFLFKKTIERAHMPNRLWDQKELPLNKKKQKVLIKQELEFWNPQLIRKCLKRAERHMECIEIRPAVKREMFDLEAKKTREEKNDRKRERKAEKKANVEATVKRHVLKKLDEGVYGALHSEVVTAWAMEEEKLAKELMYSEESDEYIEENSGEEEYYEEKNTKRKKEHVAN